MRHVMIGAALALGTLVTAHGAALAEGGVCAAGSVRQFERAETPFKTAKLALDTSANEFNQFKVSTTSVEDLKCGEVGKSVVGCRVIGPAIVKLEQSNQVAYFNIPPGHTAAVMGPKPLTCELD
jgi:hypothetical protein